MNNIFMDTQGLFQRRRAFNMSYRNDLTCNLGEILPVYWQDLIPNTSWATRVHALVRFMPLVAPILTNVDLYVHFWQAPYRILYGDDFTHVITGELDSEEWTGIFFIPSKIVEALEAAEPGQTNVKNYLLGDGSIFDLLGYDKSLFVGGVTQPSTGKLNARKFLMYIRLMHDWYANENVEPWEGFKEEYDWQFMLDTAESRDGDLSSLIFDFAYACYNIWKTSGYLPHQWPKDYFTSALPTLQYGLPTYLPLGDSAPVNIDLSNVKLQGRDPGTPGIRNNYPLFGFSGPIASQENLQSDAPAPPSLVDFAMRGSGVDGENLLNIQGAIVNNDATGSPIVATADLSEATAISVNEFRITNALQVFKERELRYGRKPQEYYKGFFGVTPGDLRLQMPKFLGGGRMPVNVSDVEQTSQTTTGESGSPQGTLAGKGTGIAAGFARAHCFAPEETLVLGVAWLMPKVLYAESLSRHDTKLNDRFDYYNPSFAHIGEQEVHNYELFAGTYGTVLGSKEFGYQPRYTEYRFHNSEIHGDLKGNLSYWTLARIFNSQPALNASFIYMQPEVLNRIFAVREALVGLQRNVILSIQFQAACIQPLSRYGTPGLIP